VPSGRVGARPHRSLRRGRTWPRAFLRGTARCSVTPCAVTPTFLPAPAALLPVCGSAHGRRDVHGMLFGPGRPRMSARPRNPPRGALPPSGSPAVQGRAGGTPAGGATPICGRRVFVPVRCACAGDGVWAAAGPPASFPLPGHPVVSCPSRFGPDRRCSTFPPEKRGRCARRTGAREGQSVVVADAGKGVVGSRDGGTTATVPMLSVQPARAGTSNPAIRSSSSSSRAGSRSARPRRARTITTSERTA